MTGAIVMLVVLLVVLPVAFLMLGAVVSAIVGAALEYHGRASHEGSELIDLNV